MNRPYNVAGAPFHIGLQVTVVQLLDATTTEGWLGQSGTVEYYEYDCGCGQTYPHDPMIGVRFANGALEEFWNEELRATTVDTSSGI